MKKIFTFVILFFAINCFSNTSEELPILKQKEWLVSFNEVFSQILCEKIAKDKICKGLGSSACLAMANKNISSCAKSLNLPKLIPAGIVSKESGIRIGSCVAQKIENSKRTNASCL